ncbi:MAG TPA: lysine exporter LysO family protein [Anaerovoracaceae bacterium]|nr:lysine exporter LysO family protein [Anaerovoracaceae bacterium]
MTWMPFICLGTGYLFSLTKLMEKALPIVDMVINIALIILMLTIGMNIGINDNVMNNLGLIGVNCIVISILAIGVSVILVFILEKTILPLEKIKDKLNSESIDLSMEADVDKDEEEKTSPLVYIIPASIVFGVVVGVTLLNKDFQNVLDYTLLVSLVVLYTGVGISLGANKKVFGYVKLLGFKVVFISVAIFLGSISGGMLAGLILDLPLKITMISASGMSYYSITGAYMTKVYGIEIGTYGFIVNVMREFFTVLLLPILIKVSKGSPIAGGAAGNMDTMLVPVTKFVGIELGLVALITGVILTFFVPIILPILVNVL